MVFKKSVRVLLILVLAFSGFTVAPEDKVNANATNLALGKAATSDSVYMSHYSAPNINDGNISSHWFSGNGVAFPRWISVDLGEVTTFQRWVIKTNIAGRNVNYELQTSSNGTDYSTIADPAAIVTGNTAANTDQALAAPVSSRYVRVLFTSNNGSTLSNTISEFELYTAVAPGAPTGVSATAGDGQAVVSFMPPASNGGGAITGYTVTSSAGGLTATGASSPITITGLTNGTAYTFTVTATNSAGVSAASTASNAVAPRTAPGAPAGVSATAGDGQAVVSFTPPASNGGGAITGYTVTSSPGGLTATGASSPLTVTGLTNGTAYTFTVTATNSAGVSAASTASEAVTPMTVPGAPTGVSATAGDGQAVVSFTPPASNGGGAITGYTVTSSPGGLTATGASSPMTVTGLTNGTAYTFTVTATNSAGVSAASTASDVVTPMTVPGAPTGVSATAGDGQAVVSFTPPASNGGGAITGYTVTSSPGGLTATGASSPMTITGLTNGTAYTFTVTATNSAGVSAASTASDVVTPMTVPGAPTGVSATAGDGQAVVSFTPPASNGGATITGYTVTSSPGGLTATGASSPITVTGLTNGTAYTFSVTATNSEGVSSASTASDAVTPMTVPGAPTGVSATAGDGQAVVSFTPPASDGGGAITGYTVTSSPGGLTATGASSPITITGLTNGTAYTFSVTATNSAGVSAASTASDAVTPMTVPGAPTGVSATAGDGQAVVSFTPPASDGGGAITGYTVTSSPEGLTATGASSPITITGLTNGTAYTFSVTATNSEGVSSASTASDAVTPLSNNAYLSSLTLSSGHLNPAFTMETTDYRVNVGNNVSSLTVTAAVDDDSATLTVNDVVVTSGEASGQVPLTVGSNELEVKVTAQDGTIMIYTVTVTRDYPSYSIEPAAPAFELLLNGKVEKAGTVTTTQIQNQKVTIVKVNSSVLEEKLDTEGQGAVITVPVFNSSDVVIGQLDGRMIKHMEQQQAVIEMKTEYATYTLPAKQIHISDVSNQLGTNVELQDIQVAIKVAAPGPEATQIIKQLATQSGFQVVAPVLDFTIEVTHDDTTIDVSTFNSYVERQIVIPDGADPEKITTGIVIASDGSVSHVPTKVEKINDKYYAIINSLSNSTYAVIWHPMAFKDMEQHWAQADVNDLGARMVINGSGDNLFEPNRSVTRAEFTAMIVNALGLKRGSEARPFVDVQATDWYAEWIHTAVSYQLIQGYEDGTFSPGSNITREQAMAIIFHAMKLTGMQSDINASGAAGMLAQYSDSHEVAGWAVDAVAGSVQAGIVSGRPNGMLAPKDYITRAEAAKLVRNLLQKSNLI